MPNFEITSVGFDASTSASDHKVLWISAASRAQLDEYLVGCQVLSVDELKISADPADIDYTLPGEAVLMRNQLASFAAPVDHTAKLVELLSNLLGTSDLQREGLENDTIDAMHYANFYLNKHFPKD